MNPEIFHPDFFSGSLFSSHPKKQKKSLVFFLFCNGETERAFSCPTNTGWWFLVSYLNIGKSQIPLNEITFNLHKTNTFQV